jgi:hypothetical protein
MEVEHLDVVAQLFGVELKTVYNVLSRHRDSRDPPTYWRRRHPRLLRLLSSETGSAQINLSPARQTKAVLKFGERSAGTISAYLRGLHGRS